MRDYGFRLRYQKVAFEIDTPMGPKEVAYGSGLYYRDTLSLTYRGQNVSASHLDKLRKRIQQIEDEFQAKKAADALRKEVAKNPEEAVLLTIVGANARTNTPERLVLEEIQVRGVDQRSGKALITDHTVDASIVDHAEHPTSQDRAANKVERLMEAHYCWRAADGADKPYPTHVIARYEIMSTGETLVRYMGQNTTNFYLRNLGNPSLVAFCITQPKESHS